MTRYRTAALLAALLLLVSLTSPIPRTSSAEAMNEATVRMLHVVPQGVTPRYADMTTRIPAAVDQVQQFLQTDVGRTLRVTPGVTTVSVTDGPDSNMRDQMIAQGLNDPNTIYLAFVESVGSDDACGRTYYGIRYAMLLMPKCGTYPQATPQFPYGATYLILHELLHGLGAVPSCAPNHVPGGHLNDFDTDPLFAGPRDFFNLTLDPGNDDYYGHDNAGCPDLEDSPHWESSSTPPAIVSLTPARVLETRPGQVTVDGQFQATGLIGPGVLELQVAGRGGMPGVGGASAAVINMTAIEPWAGGYITAYPCGTQPVSSSLNFAEGSITGNEVIVKLSAAGTVCLYSSVTTHLVVDVSGYAPSPSSYEPLTPARLLETRVGQSTIDAQAQGTGLLGPGVIELLVAGRGGLPTTGVEAAVMNLTAIEPLEGGYITAFPCQAQPVTSSLNFTQGSITGNEVIVKLSASGTICLYLSARTHLVADLAGYTPTISGYEPLTPGRVLETRVGQVTVDGQFQGTGLIGPGVLQLQVAGRAGVPTGADAAVVNVTAIEPWADGYITTYPCGTQPLSSSLNFAQGSITGNEVLVKLSAAGTVCLYSSVTTHLVVDVGGYTTG